MSVLRKTSHFFRNVQKQSPDNDSWFASIRCEFLIGNDGGAIYYFAVSATFALHAPYSKPR